MPYEGYAEEGESEEFEAKETPFKPVRSKDGEEPVESSYECGVYEGQGPKMPGVDAGAKARADGKAPSIMNSGRRK